MAYQNLSKLFFQFLEKVGLLWQSNKVTPAQEHIAANIIRQKIISAIDQLPLQVSGQPLVLLFPGITAIIIDKDVTHNCVKPCFYISASLVFLFINEGSAKRFLA